MTRERLTWKQAAALNIGDRNLGLEADLEVDVKRDGPLIGQMGEVSPEAGGELLPLRGKDCKITGTIERFGQTVGYCVELDGKTLFGTLKDFFSGRCVLEDIQIPTATSTAVWSALSHWHSPRTYWEGRTDGLEAFCFQLASATPSAEILKTPAGFQVLIPEPFSERFTVLDCRVVFHGKFWNLSVSCFPAELDRAAPEPLSDHWTRVFLWMSKILSCFPEGRFPGALTSLRKRSIETVKLLRPLFSKTLARCSAAVENAPAFPPGSISVAFSEIRLKAGTIGLVEPPTDRRAYSVVSIGLNALKDREYLEQVLLHECIHLVIASEGGDPHGEEFQQLSKKLGLKERHRD